jgi:hypothetical protein
MTELPLPCSWTPLLSARPRLLPCIAASGIPPTPRVARRQGRLRRHLPTRGHARRPHHAPPCGPVRQLSACPSTSHRACSPRVHAPLPRPATRGSARRSRGRPSSRAWLLLAPPPPPPLPAHRWPARRRSREASQNITGRTDPKLLNRATILSDHVE